AGAMSWYAAHIVMMVRFKDQSQERYPLWENIVLIRAGSVDEALEKAAARGREEGGDEDGSFRWGGKPATWVFAGVRKVTTCADEEAQPTDGSEVTFLELELSSADEVARFVSGEAVRGTIQDSFATPAPGPGLSDEAR